ncbi:hypothetical protein CANARDRAFT_232740 [[Candida] arabinofermentans NRRL YB-2248]|uniref:histone acetyltransferase n=1 Tax=[Candida] arabinofermentans NRRL YB-2248 TaxID=983967 RepID=A0A1E4T252_9ASCO|nr:hypothetical protein CANARDRAFT_232740 [[Candida] arabinofermentans NRRL YB-2248]
MAEESESEDGNYGSLDYRNVSRLQLGTYEFDTWFGNPVLFTHNEPEFLGFKQLQKAVKVTTSNKKYLEFNEAKKIWIPKLYFCPNCFKYTDIQDEMDIHIQCCTYRKKLPGKIMYHDGEVSIRKVKGSKHKLFCQCMCILAKFFLGNKSVFFNLDFYDFYIIYKKLNGVPTPMGFYSRELLSWEANNLSCILVIPCYQKQQLGTKLIDFSYHLSNYEQIISGPERPLSPFGKISYLSFWSKALVRAFIYGNLSTYRHITLEIISRKTGFRTEDIILALDYMEVLFESGEKNTLLDYYSWNSKSDDGFVYLEDDNYKIYISKVKLKKWLVEKQVSSETSLNPSRLILY